LFSCTRATSIYWTWAKFGQVYPDIRNKRKEEKAMSKEKKGNREAKKAKANPKAGKKLKKDPKRHDGVM
jgi:hypothetical protein